MPMEVDVLVLCGGQGRLKVIGGCQQNPGQIDMLAACHGFM
jgi:hypothetical protein